MDVNAATLNRRIQIMRYTESGRDPLNAPILTWTALGGPIRASRRDVSDQEKYGVWGGGSVLISRFIVRASPFSRGIRRADQLLTEGLTFEITGIKEVPPGRAFLEISAVTPEAI